MKKKTLIFIVMVTLIFIQCSFKDEADKKFGDQHFKTAIALIELHKTRLGEYPESLNDLKHIGDWDRIIFSSVHYKKFEEGYELNLVRGWVGKPNLEYPDDFWDGLGCIKSNLK